MDISSRIIFCSVWFLYILIHRIIAQIFPFIQLKTKPGTFPLSPTVHDSLSLSLSLPHRKAPSPYAARERETFWPGGKIDAPMSHMRTCATHKTFTLTHGPRVWCMLEQILFFAPKTHTQSFRQPAAASQPVSSSAPVSCRAAPQLVTIFRQTAFAHSSDRERTPRESLQSGVRPPQK